MSYSGSSVNYGRELLTTDGSGNWYGFGSQLV